MKNATVPKNMIISLHDITFFNIVASGSESPTTDIIKAITVPGGIGIHRHRQYHRQRHCIPTVVCNNKITSRLQSCDKGQSPIRSQHWMVVIPSR